MNGPGQVTDCDCDCEYYEDPTWLIDDLADLVDKLGAETNFWRSRSLVKNIHEADSCRPPCAIHGPSDHKMVHWPWVWRPDRYFLIERLCDHGIGHPDPDSLAFIQKHRGDDGSHGCDGCCGEEEDGS